MARTIPKGKLIIAGPGAGKTHNMVAKIIGALPSLSTSRYLAVITYTNSATNNILARLSKQIIIPNNLFIGTIHSFLNRFIVVPFSSFMAEPVGREKTFMQCGLDDVFIHVENQKEKDKRSKSPAQRAALIAKIKQRLNSRGYITFDQTLSIAEQCTKNTSICKVIANRLQYLFVDEFQDSGNAVFNIIESIRKHGLTEIYCVGDPEQYIQSFDSAIRNFSNIPILKAAFSVGYTVEINHSNYRSAKPIVDFLNHFNGRSFGKLTFFQTALCRADSSPKVDDRACIFYIHGDQIVKPILDEFYGICEDFMITEENRCIIAKKKDVINRIAAAVNNHYKDPKKITSISLIKSVQETLLITLQLTTSEFCKKYHTTVNTLRKHAIDILKAINKGEITNENTFGKFVTNTLSLPIKAGLPVKIENLKYNIVKDASRGAVTVTTIHTIKGLEAEAVLTIAKTQAELLLWIETNRNIRDNKRTNETTDYPRLGYVAFSRAERLLCIACLEPLSQDILLKLKHLGVSIDSKRSASN